MGLRMLIFSVSGAVSTEYAILGCIVFLLIAGSVVLFAEGLAAIWGNVIERLINALCPV